MSTHDDDSNGYLTSDDAVGGFGYGLGVSLGILILITTITVASYFCTRESNGQDESTADRSQPQTDIEAAVGIDEATLKTYPKLRYSQLQEKEGKQGSTTVSCCSICLGDYKDKDVIRLLPDCGHVFHLKCVDPWLRLHPTCPVCRTSPLPTPQSTPLAEVAPLAIHSRN